MAQAALQASQANQGQVTVRAAEANSAVAAIGQAKANLEAAELQLGYTTIVAKVNGVVTRKSAEVGQIVPVDDVWVTANFKETQLADVRIGQPAEVKVDVNGKVYSGQVDSVAGATGSRLSLMPPENATGNFVKVVQRIPVKIVLHNVRSAVTPRMALRFEQALGAAPACGYECRRRTILPKSEST